MAKSKMRVHNASRETNLADRADVANDVWSRFIGLLGRKGLEPGEGLVIIPCNSVHMVGMRFALDIVHLDKEGKVLRVLPNLKPNRVGPLVWRSHVTLELPVGTIAASGTVPGDQILLEPAS